MYFIVTERVVIDVVLQNCVYVVSVSNFCLVAAYPAYGLLRFLLENARLILRVRQCFFLYRFLTFSVLPILFDLMQSLQVISLVT